MAKTTSEQLQARIEKLQNQKKQLMKKEGEKERRDRTHRLISEAAYIESFIGTTLTNDYTNILKEFLLKERTFNDGTKTTYKDHLLKMLKNK